MRFDVITIFPELIEAFAEVALVGKAREAGLLQIETTSPRRFTRDRHQTVDDAPFGGGSGMVMMPEPLMAAIEAADAEAEAAGRPRNRRVVLAPSGAVFDQRAARRLLQEPGITLVCGRYEGIDERVIEACDEVLSLGDFVLSGGEVAAMAMIEAISRLIPGMVGNAASLTEESHEMGLLEYPQYTRPREFRGQAVPEVLLSGNHAAIQRWRKEQALLRTRQRRPDLLEPDTQPDSESGANAAKGEGR
jgi:tRNA (guanine37-N1)-methyltransferase